MKTATNNANTPATTKIHRNYPEHIIPVRMKIIITKQIADNRYYQSSQRHAHCKTCNINSCKHFMPTNISKSDL
ncbi:MAG TPA: hypothetical protein VJ765_06485 [Chitinophagaceae bacterium]|nr:hypothetical protein [Chitinophagaceae bacterium]